MTHPLEGWITGQEGPGEIPVLEDWYVIDMPDTLRIPEMGMTLSIVEGLEVKSNLEITRDTIQRNIREIFNRLMCTK